VKLTRIGGWSLIVAAVLFIAVFAWLAATFDYPDILDHTAAEVLPRLVALGTTGRAVWTLYALIPLLLVPAGLGVALAFRREAPRASGGAAAFACLAAACMVTGLARWPTVQWQLGQEWASATPQMREVLGDTFDTLNSYLGKLIGEFVGEVALNSFFLLTGWAFLRAGRPAWQGYAGILVAFVGFIAALRNLTPAVGPIADVNNSILPLWLIVLGVLLVRQR